MSQVRSGIRQWQLSTNTSSFISSVISTSNHILASLKHTAHCLFPHLAATVFTMLYNATTSLPILPAPSCTLVPQAPLIPGLSDNVLAVILPTIVYAIAGGFFHLLDIYNLFNDYRIHPSDDDLKRNHVTKSQCLQNVVRYHVIQVSIGLALNYGNGPTMIGDEICKIHRAAKLLRRARNLIPLALNTIGIDASRLAVATASVSTGLSQVLAGDYLSSEKASQSTSLNTVERSVARFLVSFGVPFLQYVVALTVVDTWIYFTHRLCHINKTLYRKSLSRQAQTLNDVESPSRCRPLPTPPDLRFIRIRRRLRSLARDIVPRRPQLRSRGRNRTAVGATEHALWFLCHHQNHQRSLRLCVPLGSLPPRQRQRGAFPRSTSSELGAQGVALFPFLFPRSQ